MLAIELKELELDTRYTTNPRPRIVALLRAVRQEGRDFLQSVGFDIKTWYLRTSIRFIR